MQPEPKHYAVHNSAEDIVYAPEDALKEGLGMVQTLKANIKKLELGSKLRKDVWLREIERSVCISRESCVVLTAVVASRTKERRLL